MPNTNVMLCLNLAFMLALSAVFLVALYWMDKSK